MTLIVEDGTGLDDSDSYIDLESAYQLAIKYGLALPDCEDDAEAALRNGALYVDLKENSFTGTRLENDQALSWPRVGATKCNGVDIASDSVPSEVIKAQVFAAAEYGAGTDVRASTDGREISSEKVSSIAVAYFESGVSGSTKITRSDDALRNIICVNANPYTQRTLRV